MKKERGQRIDEATIELDVMDPVDKRLINTVKQLDLGMNILTWNGPGGGHPAVEFSGERKDLEKLLDKHFGGKEDFEGFIEESAKPITEATIELDVMDPVDKRLINTVKQLDLGMNILTWNGPGGGHPAVEFSGERKDLEKLLDKHFGGKEDFEGFIEEGVSNKRKSNFKHVMLFEEFTHKLNEAKLKPGRDEPIARAIIAYFYAVEGTPEGDAIRAMGQNPIRSDVKPKNHEMMKLGGWSKDAIKALANVRRVPGKAMLGTVVTLAADNGKSYYVDGVEFVEDDTTIINRIDKIGFREFVDALVKKGVIEAPKY